MAFDLLERNEQDFYESLVQHSPSTQCIDDYKDTGLALWKKVCEDRGFDFNDELPEMYNIQDSLCLHTYRCLSVYLEAPTQDQLASVPLQGLIPIAPERNRESLSMKEKIKEDKDILWGK